MYSGRVALPVSASCPTRSWRLWTCLFMSYLPIFCICIVSPVLTRRWCCLFPLGIYLLVYPLGRMAGLDESLSFFVRGIRASHVDRIITNVTWILGWPLTINLCDWYMGAVLWNKLGNGKFIARNRNRFANKVTLAWFLWWKWVYIAVWWRNSIYLEAKCRFELISSTSCMPLYKSVVELGLSSIMDFSAYRSLDVQRWCSSVFHDCCCHQ